LALLERQQVEYILDFPELCKRNPNLRRIVSRALAKYEHKKGDLNAVSFPLSITVCVTTMRGGPHASALYSCSYQEKNWCRELDLVDILGGHKGDQWLKEGLQDFLKRSSPTVVHIELMVTGRHITSQETPVTASATEWSIDLRPCCFLSGEAAVRA